MDKNSTIAVLGSGGLAGSAIVRRLIADGHSESNIYTPRSSELDLRQQADVRSWFLKNRID